MWLIRDSGETNFLCKTGELIHKLCHTRKGNGCGGQWSSLTFFQETRSFRNRGKGRISFHVSGHWFCNSWSEDMWQFIRRMEPPLIRWWKFQEVFHGVHRHVSVERAPNVAILETSLYVVLPSLYQMKFKRTEIRWMFFFIVRYKI